MNLCDTNVISELTRREPNAGVLDWADGIRTVAISVVTFDEIVFGLAWKPIPRIAAWFEEFMERHCEILPVNSPVARVSGQIRGRLQAAGQSRSQADMLIAATAKVHGLTLVTTADRRSACYPGSSPPTAWAAAARARAPGGDLRSCSCHPELDPPDSARQ